MPKLSKANQAGRSMIEAIGYISVMIMISIAAASVVDSGYSKYRMSRVNQQLTDLKKVVSQRYVAAEDYKAVSMETLVEEKIAPHDVAKGKHAFGGEVKVGADSEGETFFIEFDGLPRVICVELGLRIWIINDGSDLDAMKINGKTWGWPYSNSTSASSKTKDLPAKPADVADACSKEFGNDIIWYFN